MSLTRRPPMLDALRRWRAATAMLMLMAMLCAQAALAGYRCPQLSSTTARADHPTPCHQIDPDAPVLCKAYVQGDGLGPDGPRGTPLDLTGTWILHSGTALLVLPRSKPRAARPRFERRLRARPPPLWIQFGRRRD